MADRNWPGARWWKCDFHVHTNSSADVTDGGAACADVVGTAIAQSIDVLAITDHNTGAAIPEAKRAASHREDALFVMPGVELNVSGIHLLVLFAPGKSKDDVTAFLGACGITGAALGNPEANASCTITEAMRLAVMHEGVTIAAHIDGAKGVLTVIPNGQSLIEIVRDERLFAGEIKTGDAALLSFVDNTKGDYRRRFGPLPLVESSDAHRHEDVGSNSTWVKMTIPSVEGLRLAFQDGGLSVRRGSETAADPNAHARFVIESVSVSDTKLMGRGDDFELGLNPWFNAIIGGRGTGKSTLVEMTRLALGREDELPAGIRGEFESLARVPDKRGEAGLLLVETAIEVIYRKDDDRYKIRWESGGRTLFREAGNDTWEVTDGDVTQRFPVQIFSQKQVFEIARNPAALLNMVDEAIEEYLFDFGFRLVATRRDFVKRRREYLSLGEEVRAEGTLKGELEDVSRRIAVYERAEHATVRTEYRARLQQQQAINDFGESLEEESSAVQALADSFTVPKLDLAAFDANDPVDAQVLAQATLVQDKSLKLGLSLSVAAEEATSIRPDFEASVAGLHEYTKRLEAAIAAHEELKQRLEEEANGGFDGYEALVSRRSELLDSLRGIDDLKPRLKQAKDDLDVAATNVASARQQETKRRLEFIENAVGSSLHIRIEVVPYGSRSNAESRLRAIIGRLDGGFDKDLTAILEDLYESYGDSVPDAASLHEFEVGLQATRTRLLEIACGNAAGHQMRDARFAAHMSTLGDDACSEIELWTPDDSLRVSYSPNGDGKDFKPLEHGSPGQKTAALLAFILSYGDSPIVLDQPEDDLENRLIYELVVRRIREVKGSRQVVVVTHDANIVVNGDAELVAVFDFLGGRTVISQQGGLQEQTVREAICEVLEGGRVAFEERYRRIGDGGG